MFNKDFFTRMCAARTNIRSLLKTYLKWISLYPLTVLFEGFFSLSINTIYIFYFIFCDPYKTIFLLFQTMECDWNIIWYRQMKYSGVCVCVFISIWIWFVVLSDKHIHKCRVMSNPLPPSPRRLPRDNIPRTLIT